MNPISPTVPTRRFGKLANAAIVIAASVGTGVTAGALAWISGLPAPVLFAVMLPPVSILVWQFVLNRPGALDEIGTPGPHTVLLDTRATWSRLVQVVGPLSGTLLGTVGVAQLIREDGGGVWAVGAAVAGVALVSVTLMYAISWEVAYKGHQITFENHPCRAERLFIDGKVVDRGGLGVLMVLHGTIEKGDGAGERITAVSQAGFSRFTCRIVAESDRES